MLGRTGRKTMWLCGKGWVGNWGKIIARVQPNLDPEFTFGNVRSPGVMAGEG